MIAAVAALDVEGADAQGGAGGGRTADGAANGGSLRLGPGLTLDGADDKKHKAGQYDADEHQRGSTRRARARGAIGGNTIHGGHRRNVIVDGSAMPPV